MLDPVSLSAFAMGLCKCVLEHVFSALAGSLQLGLSLHFLLVQRLKVS